MSFLKKIFGDSNQRFINSVEPIIEEINSLEEKFKSFGWETVSINGHSYREILGALRRIGHTHGRPLAIIANTVKGKGISFMENKSEWHNRMPDAAQQEQAWRDLQINTITD